MRNQADHIESHTTPAFAGGEGLRALLARLHGAGPGAWRTDREARELIEYSVDKYRRLAIKWNRDPAEAGHAAFLAMQGEWVRKAHDPWAEVTTAVQRELRAEATAERLLISTAKARRREESDFPRPIRASEHEELLFDVLGEPPSGISPLVDENSPSVLHATRLLVALGWPIDITEPAVDFVAGRLSKLGDRERAYASLRRDAGIPAQLDIPRPVWTKLLRLLIGVPSKPGLPARHGILVRLLLGETPEDLLNDDALVLEAVTAMRRAAR